MKNLSPKDLSFCNRKNIISILFTFASVLSYVSAYILRKMGLALSSSEISAIDKKDGSSFSAHITSLISLFISEEGSNSGIFSWICCVEDIAFYPLDVICSLVSTLKNILTSYAAKTSQDIYNFLVNTSFYEDVKLTLKDITFTWDGFVSYAVILIIAVVFIWAVLKIIFGITRRRSSHYEDYKDIHTHVHSQQDMSFTNGIQLQRQTAHLELTPLDSPWWRSWHRLILKILLCSFLLSIPWEFTRIYQEEVAKRVTVSVKGIPPECDPVQMTTLQSISSLLKWLLFWGEDPCQNYHKSLLVDPIWEVTPMMVVLSAVTRCIARPVEILSSSTGRIMASLCHEIPPLWQPFVVAFLGAATVLALIMMCGYRISIPLCFRMEPSHTTSTPNCRRAISNGSHR